MRVLPRSPAGTWALAAAAWLGLSTLAWWLLPCSPRIVVSLPARGRVLGVGAGARTVAVQLGLTVPGNAGSLATGPIRVCDTTPGAARPVLAEVDWSFARLSPDGRWLAGLTRHGAGHSARLIDLASGREAELAMLADDGPVEFSQALFSPDGRWLAVAWKGDGLPCVRVWELPSLRLVAGPLPAGRVVFSPDGSRLAAPVKSPAAEASDAAEYVVWEVATGREVARLRRPAWFAAEAFTPDGTGLIFRNPAGADRPQPQPRGYVCFDLADGRERWAARNVVQAWPVAGGRQLVVRTDPSAGDDGVVVLDADRGTVVGRIPLGTDDSLATAGPDGRTLTVLAPRPAGLNAVWVWMANHGLPAPQPGPYMLVQLIDVATGRRMVVQPDDYGTYAPDGRSLVTLDPRGRLEVWDVPPPKSLTWFAGIVAALAVPPAWLARRRVRGLRRGVV